MKHIVRWCVLLLAAGGAACTGDGDAAREPVPAAEAETDTISPLTEAEVQLATGAEEAASAPAVPFADIAAASVTKPQDTGPTRRRIMVGDLDLTNVGYDKGDPRAPLVLINFSDFGCPYCASFALETFPELEREYVATGKVYYKHVPFVMGMFQNGQQAARAAECGADQGKFWEMHDRVYAAQRDWKRARSPYEPLAALAVAAGLDTATFRRCFNDHRTEPRTKQASRAADRIGIRATPTFILNDRAAEGALPLPEFRRVLDAMYREATAR